LADENNLFAQALAAKRRGDLRGALAAFERFVARFPDAALAESAYVERMRLLRVLAMPRAVAAAREYTTIYPGGFARSEAEAIVAGSL
jgi:outer membrane protein assembly factor BamD (BamD/ComL family)